MQQKRRLTGIDLFRGVAIFAVVLLHSDEGIRNVPVGWIEILEFSNFAVPFFLATAFYLSIDRLYKSETPYSIKTRIERLLIPYAIWTFIYLAYKSLKFWVAGETDNLAKVYHDPMGLIFFGGAAFHLYFLPLLTLGTPLVKLAERVIRSRISFYYVTVGAIASLLLYTAVLATGNGFQLGPNIAFQPLVNEILGHENQSPVLRLVLGMSAWILRCLPYVLVAMTITHPTIKERIVKQCDRFPMMWFSLFLIVNAFGSIVLPEAFQELLRGYVTLLFAISISSRLPDSLIIKKLGLYSFGIYLIHLLFVEVFQIVVNRIYPPYIEQVSTPILLGVSLVIFLLSWAATSLLMRSKFVSHWLFGL